MMTHETLDEYEARRSMTPKPPGYVPERGESFTVATPVRLEPILQQVITDLMALQDPRLSPIIFDVGYVIGLLKAGRHP